MMAVAQGIKGRGRKVFLQLDSDTARGNTSQLRAGELGRGRGTDGQQLFHSLR